MSSKMSIEECQQFLAGLHVAVLSVADGQRGPLSVPVWYLYQPGGEVRISTQRSSRKVGLIEQSMRISLCVQDEQPPYKYVSLEGPVSLQPTDLEHDYRPLAYRYLGRQGGEAYVQRMGGEQAADGSVLIRLRPERWYSADYS